MSGFFGIFRPQGGSVDLEAFEQMRKATEREGFDGMETHVEEKIAMGHLMLRVSPESKYDKQPLKSSCGNYLLVGHFRLDYRDELGDKLGLTQLELELTPDSQLVMLSYQKWKEKCVHHIEGDWAFALYDNLKNSLFLVKDQTGFSALFYSQNEDFVVFSSDSYLPYKIERIKFEVDTLQFCRLSLPGLRIENGFTLLRNLFHVKNGHFIFFNQLLLCRVSKYWDFIESNVDSYKYECDLISSFFNTLFLAVKTRLNSKNEIGLLLSSGLDSMAVGSISSLELEIKKKNLYTFTSYPSFQEKLSKKEIEISDETPMVKEFSKKRKNVVPAFFNFPNIYLSDLVKVNKYQDFYNPLIRSNDLWIRGILEYAKSSGVNSVLNAQLGNFTISCDGYFVHAGMFMKFKYRSLFIALNKIRQNLKKTFWQIFKERVLIPIYFQFKSYFKYRFHLTVKYFNLYPFFDKKIYKSVGLWRTKNIKEFVPGYFFIQGSRSLRIAQLKSNTCFSGMVWYKYGNDYGIENSDPTSDKRVISKSLSIPENIFNKSGQYKYLYKKMMALLVDKDVITNKKNMIQSYDMGFRLKYDKNLWNLVKGLKINPNKYKFVNEREVSKLLTEITKNDNPQKNRNEIMRFLHTFSILNFLSEKNSITFEKK
jgi:asparagine synthase (glutamine-hydrolysing)